MNRYRVRVPAVAEPSVPGPGPSPSEGDAGVSHDPKDRVTAAIQALFRLEGSRRLHQQLASAAGVSISQQGYRLLGRVVEGGPTSPGQLASMLELDPAVVTRLLRQLEEARWVSRHRSVEDGRMTVVEATAEGRETFERMREVIWRHMRRALSGWSHGEVAELSALLERLVEDVQREPYPSLSATTASSM